MPLWTAEGTGLSHVASVRRAHLWWGRRGPNAQATVEATTVWTQETTDYSSAPKCQMMLKSNSFPVNKSTTRCLENVLTLWLEKTLLFPFKEICYICPEKFWVTQKFLCIIGLFPINALHWTEFLAFTSVLRGYKLLGRFLDAYLKKPSDYRAKIRTCWSHSTPKFIARHQWALEPKM